jgi:hypothetical protein
MTVCVSLHCGKRFHVTLKLRDDLDRWGKEGRRERTKHPVTHRYNMTVIALHNSRCILRRISWLLESDNRITFGSDILS